MSHIQYSPTTAATHPQARARETTPAGTLMHARERALEKKIEKTLIRFSLSRDLSFHEVDGVILCCDLSIGKEVVPIMKEYCSFYPKYLYKRHNMTAGFLKDQGFSWCVPAGKFKGIS